MLSMLAVIGGSDNGKFLNVYRIISFLIFDYYEKSFLIFPTNLFCFKHSQNTIL